MIAVSRPSPTKLGIIGAAADRGWARSAHIPAIKAVDALELFAVATTSQTSADAALAAFGATLAFGDPHAMIDHPDVQAVAVVVKAPSHHELVQHALSVGKPVYCEWPLGKSFEETESLAALARERRLTTQIGLQGRFSPWLNAVRDVVGSGKVGRILSTSLIAYDEFSFGTVDGGNAYMLDVANGANPLTIQGGHFIDALCMVLGEISQVSALTATSRPDVVVRDAGTRLTTDAPDQVIVAGRLASGAVASIRPPSRIRAGRKWSRVTSAATTSSGTPIWPRTPGSLPTTFRRFSPGSNGCENRPGIWPRCIPIPLTRTCWRNCPETPRSRSRGERRRHGRAGPRRRPPGRSPSSRAGGVLRRPAHGQSPAARAGAQGAGHRCAHGPFRQVESPGGSTAIGPAGPDRVLDGLGRDDGAVALRAAMRRAAGVTDKPRAE